MYRMEIIRLSDANIEEAAARSADVLSNGGIVLYPTDTLYGLGVESFQTPAVEKLYRVKERDLSRPIHSIVQSVEIMEMFATVTQEAHTLARDFLPGPLTMILKKKPEFTSGIARGMDTIGFRIPNHLFCLALAKVFPHPFTSTSANLSGRETERSIGAILDQFGPAQAEIDLVIDAGELPESAPSTVVDLSHLGEEDGHPAIIRQGAIPVTDIWEAIGYDPGIAG